MTSPKAKGYVERILFVDCETTGLFFIDEDPSYNASTDEEYQSVSWGLVVANSNTLDVVEELYVEIKWNGTSLWSKKAQEVHGLTLAYLEQHGMTEEEAVVEIASLILKYWGPDAPVCLGGHNVATFDKKFLQRLLRKYDINVKFGARTVDSSAVGFATFGTHNSDDLFDAVGLPARDPASHNALTDANYARLAVQRIRKMFNACIDG